MRPGKILIVGAGPTGLGAAYRLRELGHENWVMVEKGDRLGGLASSYEDELGFTWDVGGHILFSLHERFNEIAHRLAGNELLRHERESWIRLMERWIPYPFQNNIRHLPKEWVLACLTGLLEARKDERPVRHFEDWIYKTFGKGIADLFLIPYNTKLWATSLSRMSHAWTDQRVSPVDLERVLRNVMLELDDMDWGPNRTFQFPARGGTGGFFLKFLPVVKDRIIFQRCLTGIDIDSHTAFMGDHQDTYELLINTSPLDGLVAMIRSNDSEISDLKERARQLRHTGIFAVGIGLRRPLQGTRCWVYTPEDHVPFYRVTYFSHYSPHNVPEGATETYGSLLCETSFSEETGRDLAPGEILKRTVEGLVKTGLLSPADTDGIVSRWIKKVEYAYPIPTLERDECLCAIHGFLQSKGIFSRGRFGGWRYEVGNMDHSLLMGMELVDHLLLGRAEDLWNS
ncbi:MAG: NAD(P)-binding protein [Thermodesulfobacteriota bacterium]